MVAQDFDHLVHDRAAAGFGASVVSLENATALAQLVSSKAREHGLRVPLADMHRVVPPRAIVAWTGLFCRDVAECALVDDIAREVAALVGFDDVVVQAVPCVRVRPPERADLATPFHTDADAGNPPDQIGIWIPVVDVVSDEGLWLDAPVRMNVGQVLLFGAHVWHGSPAHRVDRTRVSVDFRILPVSSSSLSSSSSKLGWRPRGLYPASVCANRAPRLL